ncbi:flagellar hook-associated protein FlgL [Cryptosporangium arvum]|uniref:Flagellar hook-associated protein 3 n=1 Tax=Cryptosporangium arvum DSM 44712 TaxID=927661 RepID=A0A011AG39_9ACTN|nr:flagellar hook-associated protein FlgL [Cryptosporangium arvum]EXG80991.1 flagellar hook-associated protein 3 [Cryptosporangium arvum DSM 44712]
MVIRVTERSLSMNAMRGLQANQGRLSKTEEQLTSGKLISKPSDSPTGTMTAMLLRSDMRTQEQYARNAADGKNWLNTIDSTLGATHDNGLRVRDLMLQGMSAGAGGSDTARAGIAAEIDQIRDAMIGLANTKYIDRPIFGGTTEGPSAYDKDGTYLGDSGAVTRTIAEGTKLRVDAGGEEVFGTGDNQVFKVLADISEHLKSDPSQLSDDLDRLDTALTTIRTAQASVGARSNRVDSMQQTANDRHLELQTQLTEVEDIDLPKTITDMTLQQTAYQAALGATAKVIQPSLMDFLR